MTMFVKAVASSEYADIVTTLQSNVDSYQHTNDEYFLPQHFRVTNIARMLIHNNAKARVWDLGHHRVNRVAGWDDMADVLMDNELHFCHIQGYQPCVLRIEQGRAGVLVAVDHQTVGDLIGNRGSTTIRTTPPSPVIEDLPALLSLVREALPLHVAICLPGPTSPLLPS